MQSTSIVGLISITTLATLAGCADVANDKADEHPVASTSQDLRWPPPAPAAATINIGYFSKSPVNTFAETNGYFADENLTVNQFQTPSSPVIFQNVRDGVWQIALTQSDNVFNYRYNASNPLGGTFEPVIIAGQDHSNGASLVTRGTLTTCDSLRGKTLEVDSPNSGFAFVAYGILRNKCSLEKGTDYVVKVTGGTPTRYANLVAGTSDMTILNAGFQFRAEAQGFYDFGEVTDAASPYMGTAVVGVRSWLDANGGVATRFLRALRRATDWVLDPANETAVVAQLTADAGGDANVANESYAVLVSKDVGLIPHLRLDRKGLYEVAQLRSSFGGFDQPQDLRFLVSPQSGVYDLSYWRASTLPRWWPCEDDDRDFGPIFFPCAP